MEKRKLIEMGTLSRGRSQHRPRNDSKLYGGKYPFIQTGDVKNSNLYIEKYSQTYNDFGLNQSKLWPENTLCITIAANIADTGILSFPACFPDSIIGFTATKGKTDVRYVKYCFDLLQKSIQNMSKGSTQDNLSMEKLEQLEFNCPSFEKQQKIAAVLSSLDDKIALNNRINAKLEQMAKRLYDHWFVQFDFPVSCHSELVSESHSDEMLNQVQHDERIKPYKSTGGKMVWNEELKREIPAGWEVTPLKECINHINTGLNPRDNFVLGNGNIKYITVKNLTESGMIDFSNCDLIDEEARSMVHNRSDIKIGDILFASICPLGRCYLINEEPKDWDINESVFTIRPNYKNMSSQFLYNILRDEYYVRKMTQKATGSIFKGIRVDDLGKMEIVLPSKEIIDSFTAKITPLLNQQAKLQQESMKLSEMRDKLLPLLMNGQVEVR